MLKNRWDEAEALTLCSDLVGFRIVCNNIEDLARIRDAIRSSSRFKQGEPPVQDFVKKPQRSGYRAVHLNLVYEVVGTSITRVPCEIQIRTLAQDMWARLAHFDLYKQGDALPAHLHTSAERLASLLGIADQIAQDLREQMSQPLAAVEEEELTPGAMSFLYFRAFGEEAPDYVATRALKKCEELGCHRLDLVDRMLMDANLRERIREAYQRETNWQLSDEDSLLLAIVAAVQGADAATVRAAQLGQEHWTEIETVARREFEAELPETFEEFLDEFSSRDDDDIPTGFASYQLAQWFDALKSCAICGSPFINEDVFIENVLDHYELDEDVDSRLGLALVGSGLDLGNGSLCSYHAYAMTKDD